MQSEHADRFAVHEHLDSERGFLDAEQCAALVGSEHAHADFYICGPGPYMDTVEAGLALLGVAPEQVFIERFVVPERPGRRDERSRPPRTESVVIRLDRRKHTVAYHAGDTVLETARACGSAAAVLVRGRATAQRAWRTSTRDPWRCA